MKPRPCSLGVIAVGLMSSGCLRPAEERALSDLEIGFGAAGSVTIATPSAHLRVAREGALELWANHPVVELSLEAEVAGTLLLEVDNCMPGAELSVLAGTVTASPRTSERSTLCGFDLVLEPGLTELRIAPTDFDDGQPFRFVVMGDIQTGLDRVGDVFETIAGVPGARFVVSTGDLVEHGLAVEYDQFFAELRGLPVPYFSAPGNHDLYGEEGEWARRLGRHNLHFGFKDVFFTFLDTGNATIDPLVYEWLDVWLEDGREGVHVYGQHYPAIDPVGVRQASMRSRNEAARLLSKLAGGQVDVTFYGHLHSYYAYQNHGMPAYISGGGGAIPERWDGVGRHVLSVDVDPGVGISQVGLVRVE